jgi:hypothetical protein
MSEMLLKAIQGHPQRTWGLYRGRSPGIWVARVYKQERFAGIHAPR